MLHKAWMPPVEIRQSLGLYTLPQHAVRGTSELIPLLTYDTMTKQVTAVHGNILELLAAPDTLFLQQVLNPKQEYGFRIEDRSDVDDGSITHRGYLSGDGHVTGIIRAAREPAHLCRCRSAELRGDHCDRPSTNELVACASYV